MLKMLNVKLCFEKKYIEMFVNHLFQNYFKIYTSHCNSPSKLLLVNFFFI